MSLFDLNAFHGSGSGGTKEALDEQVSRARHCIVHVRSIAFFDIHRGICGIRAIFAKYALDSHTLSHQWEIQQEILRARRGDKSHHAKKGTVASPNLKIKPAKKDVKVNRAHVDDIANHHKTVPKFFWGLGK